MRHNFLFISLIVGVLITISTEVLSLFHAINSLCITLLWACVLVAVIFQFRKSLFSFPKLPSLETFEWIMLAGIGIFLLILGIIAFLAPPNTSDSMSYHMPRVMHWIQNLSINAYPTNDERHIWKSGFAEYTILHLQLLFHCDRFSNFVQWLCYLGNIIGVTLITKELCGNRLTQICSAVIPATIPMGILQATSTQNDLVSSFWLVSFTYFILAWNKLPNLKNALCLAASLSLGLATKEINFIYSLPLIIWFIVWGTITHRKKIALPLLLMTSLVFILNGPHWLRNYQLYQHPLSSTTTTESFVLSNHALSIMTSNVLLNIGNHLKTPWENLNVIFQNMIGYCHHLMGMTIETSGANMASFKYVQSPMHEDNAGNLLHLVLILCSLLIFIIYPKVRTAANARYALVITGLFLSFIWFMKWSIFHNRVQLLIFILFCPFIADVLIRTFKEKISFIFAIILLLCALPWLLCNVSRPLIGSKSVLSTPRLDQYFANLSGAPLSYKGAVQEIQQYQCSDIGYALGEDTWEYPLWILLKTNPTKNFRIEHVLGNNPTFHKLEYPLGSFNPCAILQSGASKDTMIRYNDEQYIQTLQTPFLNVYINVKWGMMMQGRQ